MRTLVLALLLVQVSQAICITLVNGQVPVLMEMIPTGDGPDRQAYTVTIPMVELKRANRCWSEYLEEHALGWESVSKGIHRQSGIHNKSISESRFSVYNEIVMTTKGVRLTIWFKQKRKPLIAKESGDALDMAMRKFIHDFAIPEYRREIQSRLKHEQCAKQQMELKRASLNRAQENPNRALNEDDYMTQKLAINLSIEAQNVKMTKLLEALNRATVKLYETEQF